MDNANAVPYVIEMRNITKIFGDMIANDNITLNLKKGEIHALLGENGAGKSTLMNILFGLYKMDEGKIYLNGKEVKVKIDNITLNYFIDMTSFGIAIVVVFIIGYAFIALESVTKVNKAAIALLMCVLCWSLYSIGCAEGAITAGSLFGQGGVEIHELGKVIEICIQFFIFLHRQQIRCSLEDLEHIGIVERELPAKLSLFPSGCHLKVLDTAHLLTHLNA